MNRIRFTNIVGSLIIGTAVLIVVWALVLGGAPTSAAPAGACPTDLFFSEYIEGSSYNKAIEIYNGTGSDITFTGQYTLALYSNGSASVSQFVALVGSITQGDVFVIAHGSASTDILNEADQTSSTVINFNGDDAIALYNNGVLVDVIGQIGSDPGSEWGSGDASTADNTLVRKSSITAGDTDGSDAFDPADEWDGYAQDTFTYLGSHTMDFCGVGFSIAKSAPTQVKPNEVFTYTIVVGNYTGITPTMTTITDVVPTGADFASASDGGIEMDGMVTWLVPGLADGDTVTRTFQVTATAAHGEAIENADYGVNGGVDWTTTTLGLAESTYVADCTSIYGVQYPGGDSLCEGETVAVEGIVYAVYGSDGFAMAEDAGAWHGVYVYDSSVPMPEIGDSIRITSTVAEYSGLTELTNITYTVISTGNTPYAASVISTAGAASSEAYEGVLVEVQDVIVSDENPDDPDDYGEWEVDDGSGGVRVDDMAYSYEPTLGDALDFVRGMLTYRNGDYKIEPRDADDVLLATGSGLLLSKDGPAWTPPGETFTYTLMVENQTAQLLNDLTVSDTLPLSLTYASSNPTGNWDDATHTITWTAASLAYDSVLSYTIVVTAPTATTAVSNTDYAVWASNWSTPTVGDPVETLIRDCNTIYGVQYTTDAGSDGTYPSLCAWEAVTLQGIVYAIYGNNYFIADAAGPWHGLYIYSGGPVNLGDEVEITGLVREYYGVTEIGNPAVTVLSSGNALYGPDIVTAAQIPFDDPDTSEGYEGVFVEVRDITVTATESYGVWAFTDSGGGTGKADDWAYTPDPAVGDFFALLRGPLDYSYDEYKVLPRDADDALQGDIIFIDKTAPATVGLGGVFTYTLTIENRKGFTLNDVVITDVVPANTTFAYALDGGVEANGVVSWTVSTMDHLDEISVRFVVTAANTSAVIVNDDYAVAASNYVTPTFGKAVNTAIGQLGIYHLQGDGAVSPYLGQEATVQGVVVADFQESDELDGFFIQDSTGDGDPLTSDGIFVYDPSGTNVAAGDLIEVTGTVDEYYYLTQLESVSDISIISSGHAVVPTQVTLPEQVNGDLERYEGMLVTIPHTMTVEQNYFQGRYGQVTLGSGGRLYQPTNVYFPGSQAAIDLADENARRLLILDDGSSDQNPDPVPYIGVNDTLRAGDVVAGGLTGVLDYGRINSSYPAANDYRLHPTAPVYITRINVRTAAPDDVGGSLRVASFNVLNYFNGDGMGGGFPTSRGADTLEEFDRQRTKIISAVLALDADVVGLMEIENDGYDEYSAIQDLVNGLNDVAGAGTYAFVDPGVSVIGTDEIAVGLLYRPGTVTPVGSAAILNSTFDPAFIDTLNRPALAQTFAENATDARFTAAVNHLKSKGSDCDDVGDPDTGDGQGNCNLTRTDAMTVEVAWLATDPTGSGDPDFIIIGDLNSHAMEDPITAAKDAGYTDLLQSFEPGAYTYIFDGLSGYLDHALANGSLASQVTGATAWHINADEPSVIDYNTEYKPEDLYSPTVYRASDHDPVVVGLDLVDQTALTITKSVEPVEDVEPGDTVTYTITIENTGDADVTGVVITDELPAGIEFGGWVQQGSALLPDPPADTITWEYPMVSGASYTFIFTATVTAGSLHYDVTNVASFTSDNGGSGSDAATFTTAGYEFIYLPLVVRNG